MGRKDATKPLILLAFFHLHIPRVGEKAVKKIFRIPLAGEDDLCYSCDIQTKRKEKIMKKLLAGIMSVAMLVGVAWAEDTGGSWKTGTDFEKNALNVGDVFNPTADDEGGTNGEKFWSMDGKTDDDVLVITNSQDLVAEGAQPPTGLGDKALLLDTANRLTRNIKSDKSATEIGSGIEFDALVQFTVTDGEPEKTDGDKFIVWLKDTNPDSEEDTPKIFVMANDPDNLGTPKAFDTGVTANANEWHQLTIKAISESGFFDTSSNDEKYPGFQVLIDGNVVGGSENPTTFVSMQGANDTTYNKLTSVSFEGQGAIDSLLFTKAPDVPTTFNMTYTVVNTANLNLTESDDTVSATGGNVVKSTNGYVVELTATELEITIGTGEESEVDNLVVTVTTTPQMTEEATFSTIAPDGEAIFTYSYKIKIPLSETMKAQDLAVTVTLTKETVDNPVPITPTLTVPEGVTLMYDDATVPATFAVGATIDPAKFAASKNGYKTTVEVKVNGKEISESHTLAEGDKLEITVTESVITYTINYVYQDEAGDTVDSVNNENPLNFTVKDDMITIDSTKISKDGYTVESVNPSTIDPAIVAADDATEVLVTVTLKKAEPEASDPISPAEGDVMVPEEGMPVKPAGYPSYVETDPTDSESAAAAAARMNKFTAWLNSKAKNLTVGAAETEAVKEAFLLNVKVTGDESTDTAALNQAIEKAKQTLLPKISIDGGEVTVTAPDGSDYNGSVEVKGSATIGSDVEFTLNKDDHNARFYKTFLK